VTTVVLGNCGVTFAPVRPGQEGYLAGMMDSVEDMQIPPPGFNHDHGRLGQRRHRAGASGTSVTRVATCPGHWARLRYRRCVQPPRTAQPLILSGADGSASPSPTGGPVAPLGAVGGRVGLIL
jgi:hypothetical protein